MEYLAVAFGGVLGVLARYGLAQWIDTGKRTFPWPTFAANVSGAFVLGCFLAVMSQRSSDARVPKAFVAGGLLGSFTTFSAVAAETSLLVGDDSALLAMGYVVATMLTGLVAVAVGAALGRRGLWRVANQR